MLPDYCIEQSLFFLYWNPSTPRVPKSPIDLLIMLTLKCKFLDSYRLEFFHDKVSVEIFMLKLGSFGKLFVVGSINRFLRLFDVYYRM